MIQPMADDVHYLFKIFDVSPSEMQYNRLLALHSELIKVFSKPEMVHWEEIRDASTGSAMRPDPQYAEQFIKDIQSAQQGTSNKTANNGYEETCHLLHDYGYEAGFFDDKGSNIVPFRPVSRKADKLAYKTIGPVVFVGELMRGGRKKDGNHTATLDVRSGKTSSVVSVRVSDESKEFIQKLLYQVVRVSGMAEWTRSESGDWTYENVKNAQIEAVKDVSLSQAFAEIREANENWPNNTILIQEEQRKSDT